jgi:hypothetical protein
VQARGSGNIFAPPLHERVEDDDLVTPCDERVHHVGADEAGSAGDDDPHGGILRWEFFETVRLWIDRRRLLTLTVAATVKTVASP